MMFYIYRWFLIFTLCLNHSQPILNIIEKMKCIFHFCIQAAACDF